MTRRSDWMRWLLLQIVVVGIACGWTSGDLLRGEQAGTPAPPRRRLPHLALHLPSVPPEPLDYADHTGWTSIFDGRTLDRLERQSARLVGRKWCDHRGLDDGAASRIDAHHLDGWRARRLRAQARGQARR